MKDNILAICLGNNLGNLYGSKNDAILFFNYLYTLYEKKDLEENWLKPNILLDSDVVVDNITKIIVDCKIRIDKILIFYSGHGFSDMRLNISKKNTGNNINDRELIEIINKSIKNSISLYVILDCCYSGKFNITPFDKVKKINLISSCSSKEKSSESVSDLTILKPRLNKEYKNLNLIKKNLIVGVFTYNLIDLMYSSKISLISEFQIVFNQKYKSIWDTIKIISKQTPKIIWE